MKWVENMKPVDFFSKHNIMLENTDGTLTPMDEPYFRATQIAPGTWQVLSDGDHTYLVEGNDEALAIDSGYGCGDIRAFCQTLTSKPVLRIANTHNHFDHTANNYLFDCAYMSQETYEHRTIPFPSFSGIDFPRDYPVAIIGEGYVFNLGGRDLKTFKFCGHSLGSLMFLDRKERLLFSGDEILTERMPCRYPVEHYLKNMEKLLSFRGEYDRICTGPGIFDASWIDRYYEALKYILDGHENEGVYEPSARKPVPPPTGDPNEKIIYTRREPHPCDLPSGVDPDAEYKRTLRYKGCTVIYDIRKLYGE